MARELAGGLSFSSRDVILDALGADARDEPGISET
jgi:hypothetical protein